MKIDADNALTKHSKKKDQVFVQKSDHHLLICHFNIKQNLFEPKKGNRQEMFNFNHPEGWIKYKKLTAGSYLTKSFKGVNLHEEGRIWLKRFKNILHRSFRKIRMTNKLPFDIIHELMVKKAKFYEDMNIIKLSQIYNEKQKVNLLSKCMDVISSFDFEIAQLTSEKNAKKIKSHFLGLSQNGKFSAGKMWQLRKKLNLNSKGNDFPIAKSDSHGNLITTKQGIIRLYEEEYKQRLSQSPPHHGLETLQILKENLFRLRLKISSLMNVDKWTNNELLSITKKLKNKKARDCDGIIYELFKPGNCGSDVINSLLCLFNNIKEELTIPDFFQNMKITSIYKSKGLKTLLSNERSIFNLSKPRNLIDKLIYENIYKIIDQNMSCSNVGGRRGRSMRDQLFIIYSIINEVVHGKGKNIDIQSTDIVQAFDKMNFYETHNDLWDVGIQDKMFALIAQLDRTCKVSVKTPCGETEKFTLNDLIMQGSTFGSIKCSVQIDTLGREHVSKDTGLVLYSYKNMVDIPPLCLADDILGVSNCGIESIELNAAINAKVESKKLNMGHDKCFRLHIASRRSTSECNNSLKVHNLEMKNAKKIKYLGDFLNSLGNLEDTISDRNQKAIGLRSQLASILKSISLGVHFFEVAMILRDSSYLNALLCNSESWGYLTKKQLETFESADCQFFQICFQSSSKTIREAYYLETGKLRLKHIFVKRRMMFLFNILKREPSDTLFKTYQAQKISPTRYDWFLTITQNKAEYKILLSDDEIRQMSKFQFKKYLETRIFQHSYEELFECKKSKLQNILQSIKLGKNKRIIMQNYLKSNILSVDEKQFAFNLRCRNFMVKSNFKTQYEDDMKCRICLEEDSYEDEEHTFFLCSVLLKDHSTDAEIKFEHLYGDLEEQIRAIKYFKQIADKRQLFLEIRNENC